MSFSANSIFLRTLTKRFRLNKQELESNSAKQFEKFIPFFRAGLKSRPLIMPAFGGQEAYFLIVSPPGVIISAMRIPLTKYGLPQVVVLPLIVVGIMVICFFAGREFFPAGVIILIEAVLGLILIWTLAFFRDPYRRAPEDKDLLLSPADGTITDIEVVENNYIGGEALRIGIFLSIFDAHINRTPCRVKVKKIIYKKGRFKDARDPQSSQVNESNDLHLLRSGDPAEKLLLRQISGAIARRIVCEATEGDSLAAGEKFGMLKFGSRTELYLPAGAEIEMLVKKGDRVKAALTPLIRYKKCQE